MWLYPLDSADSIHNFAAPHPAFERTENEETLTELLDIADDINALSDMIWCLITQRTKPRLIAQQQIVIMTVNGNEWHEKQIYLHNTSN